ncbi:hypothetical protein AYO27_13480 [Rhizobium sp. GHKF11]|nr:hypothetical protein AYO27_13480 [Rhizobium sp. GHKF11]
MSVKTCKTARATERGIDSIDPEAARVRRILEAVSVVAELMLTLQADSLDRSLEGFLLVVGEKTVSLENNRTATERNTASIPMPRGTRIRHLLEALKAEDGDVELAIKLLSVRFAEANNNGRTLNMYRDEEIGGPSVALHMAIRAHVDGKV